MMDMNSIYKHFYFFLEGNNLIELSPTFGYDQKSGLILSLHNIYSSNQIFAA